MAQKRKIKVGDKVPIFKLIDQNGTTFDIKNFVGKQPMVIYFYPKDNTSGCTKEACKFRDEFEDFTDIDALVIGISSDSVESHKQFEKEYNLPFILLSDKNKQVRKLFGVPNSMGFIPGRVTYIINKLGEIIYIFNSMTNAEKHVAEAKKALKIE
jgi:peroxiredoxin Q/BCP